MGVSCISDYLMVVAKTGVAVAEMVFSKMGVVEKMFIADTAVAERSFMIFLRKLLLLK